MTTAFQSLQGVKVLNKNAQKKISGGLAAGTCAYQSADGGIGAVGVSKADAIAGATANGSHWCCDSCGSARWLNDPSYGNID